MPLHRQHAAWLLGLEGVALLRYGAGDQWGQRFLEARLREVRQIVDMIDHEAPLIETGEISVLDGYALWASTYDQDHNPLLAAEDRPSGVFSTNSRLAGWSTSPAGPDGTGPTSKGWAMKCSGLT